MNEQDYGIAAAIAAAGVPVVQPEQPAEPAQAEQSAAVPQEGAAEQVEYYDYVSPDEQPQQPAAPQPAQSAPQPTAQTFTPEVAEMMRRNQEMLQQAFTAQQQQNADRIKDLEARLAAYDATKPAAEPEKPWYESVEIPQITDEERKAYEASLPFITAVARQQALEIARKLEAERLDPMNKHFQEVVQPLQESVQAQQANLANTTRQAFTQSLNARLPWLAEAITTPAYAQYYNAVVPGTGGLTRRVLLDQAEAAGNVDAVVDLLSGFQPPAAHAEQQRYTAPGRSNTINQTPQATAAQPRSKKGIKLSTYNAALKDYANGKMSVGQMKTIQEAWDTALLNGTASMD